MDGCCDRWACTSAGGGLKGFTGVELPQRRWAPSSARCRPPGAGSTSWPPARAATRLPSMGAWRPGRGGVEAKSGRERSRRCLAATACRDGVTVALSTRVPGGHVGPGWAGRRWWMPVRWWCRAASHGRASADGGARGRLRRRRVHGVGLGVMSAGLFGQVLDVVGPVRLSTGLARRTSGVVRQGVPASCSAAGLEPHHHAVACTLNPAAARWVTPTPRRRRLFHPSVGATAGASDASKAGGTDLADSAGRRRAQRSPHPAGAPGRSRRGRAAICGRYLSASWHRWWRTAVSPTG